MPTTGSASAASAAAAAAAATPVSVDDLEKIQKVMKALPWVPNPQFKTTGLGAVLAMVVLSDIETEHLRNIFDLIVSKMRVNPIDKIEYEGDDQETIKKVFQMIEKYRRTEAGAVVLERLKNKNAATNLKHFVDETLGAALEAVQDLKCKKEHVTKWVNFVATMFLKEDGSKKEATQPDVELSTTGITEAIESAQTAEAPAVPAVKATAAPAATAATAAPAAKNGLRDALAKKYQSEKDLVDAQLEYEHAEEKASQIEKELQKHTDALSTLEASLLATQKEAERLQAEIENTTRQKTQKEEELHAHAIERSERKRKLDGAKENYREASAKFQRFFPS